MKVIDFDFDMTGGLSNVYAIRSSDVRKVTYYPETGLWRLSLEEAADVVKIPVWMPSGVEFSEQQSLEGGCDLFEVSLTVRIPRQGVPLTVRELERGEWMVVHQDNNGDILLSGTKDLPMHFSSNRSITADANYNAGVFSCTGSDPSRVIDRRAFYI